MNHIIYMQVNTFNAVCISDTLNSVVGYTIVLFYINTGLIYALTALGVAAGYMGGGQFLSLWVDFERIDTTL